MSVKAPKIIKASEVPKEELQEQVTEKPWLGKKVTSVNETLDGVEDDTAEFVAIGYPLIRRTVSENGEPTFYVPDTLGSFQLEVVGWETDFNTAVCRLNKKNAGTPAKA